MSFHNNSAQYVKYTKSLTKKKKTPTNVWNAKNTHLQSKNNEPIDNGFFFYYNYIIKISTILKHN